MLVTKCHPFAFASGIKLKENKLVTLKKIINKLKQGCLVYLKIDGMVDELRAGRSLEQQLNKVPHYCNPAYFCVYLISCFCLYAQLNSDLFS